MKDSQKWLRLEKLADFLEKLPRKVFDWSEYWSKPTKPVCSIEEAEKCGTLGCAIGWAEHMKTFKLPASKLLYGVRNCEFWGIDWDAFACIYNGNQWKSIPYSGLDKTPKFVARRIRQVVKILRKEAGLA